MRLNKLIQATRQAAASTVTALRRIHKAGVISRINASGTQGTKDLYQYLRRNNAPPSAVIQDPDSLQYVFSVHKQHEIMIRHWKTVFDKHAGKASTWDLFLKEHGKYEAGQHDAPQECPGAHLLFKRARGGKPQLLGRMGLPPKS